MRKFDKFFATVTPLIWVVLFSGLACGSFSVSDAWAAPGKKIGELKSEGLSISISSNGPSGEAFDIEISNKGGALATPEIFALENPPRIVIDLPKVDVRGSKKTEIKNNLITGIRLGVHPGKARIVIDLGSAAAPAFAVRAANGTAPLGVKLDFAAAAGPAPDTAETGSPVDLSDLPKPDSDPQPLTAKNETVKAAPIKDIKDVIKEPGKESVKEAAQREIITEPKEPIKEPVKKEAGKGSAETALPDQKDTLTADEKELDKSLHELATQNSNLKPAPQDIDLDFQDPPKTEVGKKETAAKEPVKDAAKKEAVKSEPAKSEPLPAETELSDDEALKMLELAGEVVGKKPAAEPKNDAGKSSKTLAELAAEPTKKGAKSAEAPAGGSPAGPTIGSVAERTLPVDPMAIKDGEDEDASPEQLAKLLNDPAKTEAKSDDPKQSATAAVEGGEHPATGSINPPPAGSAAVKGIFYRAADDGKTSAVVIEVANLNNYSLSQKKKNLYELSIDQAGMAGEHVAFPQFPPDTFQGFEAVMAEQQGTTVVVKLYVAEGTKLSPFRVKDQLWVKVLK